MTFDKGFGMGLAAEVYTPKDATGQAGGHRRQRPLRRRQGGQGPLRGAHGRARLPGDGLRPFVHGEKAHGRYFGEYAFERMTGKGCDGKGVTVGNKEVLMIPGASHVDVYDEEAWVIPPTTSWSSSSATT